MAVISGVPLWFEDKLLMAMGLGSSGAFAGYFFGPILIVFLSGHYGIRGWLFITGGIWLNCLVIGTLYREFPVRHKNKYSSELKQAGQVNHTNFASSNGISKQCIQSGGLIDKTTNSNRDIVLQEIVTETNSDRTKRRLHFLKNPRVSQTFIIVFFGAMGSGGKDLCFA